MTKIKIYVGIMLIAITGMFLGVTFTIKDQYDEKLHKLTEENEELKETNVQMGKTIDSLYEEVQGKRALECQCEWLQSFYDDFHEEVGAYE